MAAWIPDATFDLTIQRVITRAREDALRKFESTRVRSLEGSASGIRFLREEEAASYAVKVFGAKMLADLLQLFSEVFGTIPADVLEWTRINVPANVRALASGLAED